MTSTKFRPTAVRLPAPLEFQDRRHGPVAKEALGTLVLVALIVIAVTGSKMAALVGIAAAAVIAVAAAGFRAVAPAAPRR